MPYNCARNSLIDRATKKRAEQAEYMQLAARFAAVEKRVATLEAGQRNVKKGGVGDAHPAQHRHF